MRVSKKTARILSSILAISMLVLLLSAAAFSAEDPPGMVVSEEVTMEDGTEPAAEPEAEEADPSEEDRASLEDGYSEGEESAIESEGSMEEARVFEGKVTTEEEPDLDDGTSRSEEGSSVDTVLTETDSATQNQLLMEEMDSETQDHVLAEAPEEDSIAEETDPSQEEAPEDLNGEDTPINEADPGIEEMDAEADPAEEDRALPEEIDLAADKEPMAEEMDPPAEEESSVQEDPVEADPYLIEGVDYSAYYGLDVSSGRLIVGTDDPSVFVDRSVIISFYRNLYMLQFADIETALKAYVYYLHKAEFVEIDGLAMAVNDGTNITGDIMTEDANPFAELKEAVAGSGYGHAFDIALIDTGASMYTTGAVSMLGEDPWDDNGHGTEMAQYIIEQDPDARILSIKAFGSNGLADMSAIYAAFQYAITQNVRIISISASAFAASGSDLLSAAVYEALAAGIIVVASAGNNGRNARWYVPGGYDGVTTIGACDENGIRIASSNYGDAVDYHVTADTTSRAAAMFSGFLNRYGFDGVAQNLNQGLIFSPDYFPTADPSDPDDPDHPSGPNLPVIHRPEVEGLEIEENRSFLVRYTFIDEKDYEDGMSITDFYQAGKNSLAQRSGYVTAYIDGEDYVFYADQPYLNGYAVLDPVAWDFAEGNNEGHVINEGVCFDPVSRIARVNAGITGTGSEFADIQLQLLIPVSLSSNVHIPIAVSAGTDAVRFAVGDRIEANPYTELSFPLLEESSATLVRALEELEIYVNGSETSLDTTEYVFDRRTGELTLLSLKGLDLISLRVHVNLMDDETLLINGYYNGTNTPVLADGRTDLVYSTGLYLKDFDVGSYSVGQTFTVTAKMTVGAQQVPAGGSAYAWYATNPYYFDNASHAPVTPGYNATYVDNAVFIGLPKTLDGQDFTFYQDAACTKPVGDFASGYSDYNGAFFAYCHHVSSSLYEGVVNASSGIVSVPFLVRIIGISTTTAGNTKIVFSIESIRAESIMDYSTYEAQTVGAVFAVETSAQKGNISFTKTASDNTGTLTVSKSASSEEEPDKRFTYTLEYGPTIEYGTSSTFTLKDGESKDLSIPTGNCWRVTEQDYSDDGWITAFSMDDWETNERGRIAVGHVSAQAGAQSFLFTVSGLTGSHAYIIQSPKGTQTGSGTIQNYGRIILRSGETATIMDIPAGSTVTAAEAYPLYAPVRTVRKGDTGGDVWGLQWLLYEFGYLTAYPDGHFGSSTENAVLLFQNTWDLYADGEVGSITGAYLNALKSVTYGGNWAGGGSVSGTVVADQTTSLGTISNTYTPDRQTLEFYSVQSVQTGHLTFAKTVENGTGSVTVSKIVEEDNSNDLFEFTLTVNGRAGSGYSYTGSRNGTTDSDGRFRLKAGENVTITGLPGGAAYTITETELLTEYGNPKYLTYVTDTEGTSIQSRMVSGRVAAASADQTFSFRVTGLPAGSYSYSIYNSLDCSGTAVSSGKVSNNDDLILKTGQSVQIRDIKAGTNVTVTETLPSSRAGAWKCDQARGSASAVVVKNSSVSAGTFTNTFLPNIQEVTFRNRTGVGYLYLIKTSESEELCRDDQLYSLEGAVYEIRTDQSHRVATLTTDKSGITEVVELPVGTYEVTEVQPSPGHTTDPSMTDPAYKTVKVEADNTPSNPTVVYSTESILRSSLSVIIRKTGNASPEEKPLEGVIFEIRYYDNTDGTITGTPLKIWRIRTLKNESGEYLAQLDDRVQEDGQTWLVEGSDTLYRQNGEIVLPIGTYTVEEIRAADGYTLTGGFLYADQEPDNRVDTEGGILVFTVEDTEGMVILSAGNTFTAFNQTVRMDTEAWGSDLESSGHTHWLDASDRSGVVIDTVTFENLTIGSEYRLTGQLYDRDSGETVGNAVTRQFTVQTREENSVQMEFEVTDLEELAGHVLVAGETLEENREGTWVLMAEEQDLTVEKQSVYVVRILTSLTSRETGLHNSCRAGSITLVDTVTYENLIPGRDYVLYGALMNKATGSAILNRNGENITSELAFVPEDKDGTVSLEFTLDDIPEEGLMAVAFETLVLKSPEEGEETDREVASHRDIDDMEQTLAIPGICTSLAAADGAKTVSLSGSVILYDTVEYTNLYPGHTYLLQGRLIGKETKTPLLDASGKEIMAVTQFVPEEPDGRVVLEFRFVAGEEYIPHIVAFEELFEEEILIADHKDPEDKEQTVTVNEPPVPEEPTREEPTTEEPTPEAPVPEEPTPESPAPEVPTTEVPTPETPTPEVPTPEVPQPETPTPEVPQPETPTPEVPTAKSSAPGVPHTGDTNGTFLWLIAGGTALLLIAAIAWFLVRRRKQ